jgi:YD repeat-containing protein
MTKQTYKSTNNSKQKQKQPKTAATAPAPPPQADKTASAGKSLSAQPRSAADLRAEFKAQQVKRLMAQVDQEAEELVDAIMGSRAASPLAATAKADRAGTVIKLGLDVHLDRYVVVRQTDGGAPQPPQRFSPRQFLEGVGSWYREVKGVVRQPYSPGTREFIAEPLNQKTTLAQDALNRLANIVDAAGATAYSYDAVGQVLSETGPWASDTVSYTYANRLRTSLSLQMPGSSAWTNGYAYDAAKRLTGVTSQAGAFAYTYDAES